MSTSLTLRIGADLSQLNARLKQAENRLKRFSFRAERIGSDLTTRVSLPIVGIGAAAVQAFAQFDRIEKGLAALGGSAKAGGEQFQRLNKIVLDTRTTLDLKTAALGAQRLQGAGLSAAFAERTIKQLGIAATVSGSAIDDVGGVLRQFTQIVGKGKIEQEDLNTILDRMPALGAVIKKEFGGVTAEAIRETGISMEEFVSRTVAAIEANEDFQGVQGGLAKSFESFANAVQVGIAPLGKAIATSLNLEQNLQRLGDFIGNVSQKFADLSPNTQRFIVLTAAAAAAVGPLSFGLGAVARSLPLLRSGFGFLLGPLSATAGLFVSATKGLAGYATLIVRGGAVGRTIALTKAVTGLRAALAVLTGPIGLAVAAIAAIAISIKRAYENSGFFRQQLDRLRVALKPIVDGIFNLAKNILPDLNISFSSIGDVFNIVFGVIAGGVSFLIESFIQFLDTVSLVGTAINQVFDGNFSGAAESLSQTLFNPSVWSRNAIAAADAAVTTFNQTAAGINTSEAFGSSVSRSGGGLAPGDDGSGLVGSGVQEANENVNKLFGAFSNLSLEVARSKAAFDSFGESLAELPTLGVIRELTEVEKIAIAYENSIQRIGEKQDVFGESFNGLQEQINLTKQTISGLIEGQLPGYGEEVEKLTGKLALLNEEQAKNVEATNLQAVSFGFLKDAFNIIGLDLELLGEKFNGLTAVLQTAVAGAATIIGSAFDGMAKSGESFGRSLAKATKSIVSSFIKQGVAALVAKTLEKSAFFGPIAVPIALAAGTVASAGFSSLIGSIPALAEGGIATGATLALIGEGNESEAVLPLSKLQSLIDMSGGGGGGPVQFRISGEDLVAVYDQGRARQNRIY